MTRLFAGTPWDRPPTCDRCGQVLDECRCEPLPEPKQWIPPERQTARLNLEKRKKGKQVTAIHGLSAEGNDLPELLTQLKNKCGAGGALQEDLIEIQGNHIERIADHLQSLGYKVRRG
ncbi:MAG: translation initiation factor [Pirellulaceae bacterium]